MSEPRADKQHPRGTSLEPRREDVLAAAKPLRADQDALIEDLTDDEARTFLAAILQA